MSFINYLRKQISKRKWRKKNKENFTTYVGDYDMKLVNVGKYTYGGIDVLTFNDVNTLSIGSFCSIGPNVKFILSAEHDLDYISTYPFRAKIPSLHGTNVVGVKYSAPSKGDILIKDDVWIGYEATIMSGVTIGQGAVVGACSVVTKDVPDYAIVAGNPAKLLKYRFDESIRLELMKVDFNNLTEDIIKTKIDKLEKRINSEAELGWIDW